MVAINFNLAVAAQVLSSLNSQVSQDDFVMPCETEGLALYTCFDQNQDLDCLDCIIDAVLTIEEGMTCEQIEATNFCSDITTCATTTCQADCSAEWAAWGTCMEALEAANADPADEGCPGLCEGQDFLQIA
jgi:hypothetical protein